jgi:hypothetical protein
MNEHHAMRAIGRRKHAVAAVLFLAASLAWCQQPGAAPAQQNPAPPAQPAAPQPPGGQIKAQEPTPKSETHITPDEAKQLFGLVDELIKFSSSETGLAVKSDVKRQLTSRAEVESYLKKKFDDDEDAKRMQRGEIVLEKFGLLDRDFALKPFLLALLKEQIEAYYDSKTKTVTCSTG